MGKITIKDIAREAGVSISTVSNALNGVDVVKPNTRDYILEVADRLHYIPDLNGRNLKSKATRVIGLFVTSLTGPYFASLADSISRECMKNGYELNIFVTWDGKSAVNSILGGRVDGCIILSHEVDEKGAEQIREVEVPTVFLDRELRAEKISSVVFDSYTDGVTAADYLIRKGKTKLCFVKGPMDNFDSLRRMRGFGDRLSREEIIVEPEYVLEGGFDRTCSHDAMAAFLKTGRPLPQAVFATNDLSALGCMDALLEAGYRIPQDLIVMGVDDIELSRWYRPALTTIQTGYETQGTAAIDKLLKMITGEESGEIRKLRGRLMERESTGD